MAPVISGILLGLVTVKGAVGLLVFAVLFVGAVCCCFVLLAADGLFEVGLVSCFCEGLGEGFEDGFDEGCAVFFFFWEDESVFLTTGIPGALPGFPCGCWGFLLCWSLTICPSVNCNLLVSKEAGS